MARGPAYPYMNLEAAVGLTRQLYEYAKRAPANLNAVLKDKWGYSPTSSTAVKTVAALRYFGLVDLVEGSDSESIRITDRAYRILVDNPSSPERQKAIHSACLSPRAYKLCWELWGHDMPPAMRSSLIFDHGFNESTVDGFLTNYKKSVQFAGLLDDALVKRHDEMPVDQADDSSQLEQANSSIAMSSLQTEPASVSPQTGNAPAQSPRHQSALVLPAKESGMRQEVFALAEGDVVIQWPERLSQDSLQDFTDWLRILERKIRRSAISSPVAAPLSSPAQDDEL